MPLNWLTYKLVALFALVTAQRAQSLHALNVNDIVFGKELVVIPIKALLKQSRPGNNNFSIQLKPFHDTSICIVETLKEYVLRTKKLRREESRLFISFQKPHKAASKDTISRWIKFVLQESGIDTEIFKSHSTRAASVSYAKSCNYPIEDILKTAGWSNNQTFYKFYDKVIMSDRA